MSSHRVSAKQRQADRREVNRRIAIADAANRCRNCKRALMGESVTNALDGRRFCSDACREEDANR